MSYHVDAGDQCCDCHCAWPCPTELLVDLQWASNHGPVYALELRDSGLAVETDEAYGYQLIDVAEVIFRHARNRRLGLDDPPLRHTDRVVLNEWDRTCG